MKWLNHRLPTSEKGVGGHGASLSTGAAGVGRLYRGYEKPRRAFTRRGWRQRLGRCLFFDVTAVSVPDESV